MNISKQTTYLGIVVGTLTVITVIAVLAFLKWSGDLKTQSYTELIENQTSALSDRISLYLARGMSDVLDNTLDAMLFTNDVIYIQVIHNGAVVADKRKALSADLALAQENLDVLIVSRIERLSEGTAYIDVTKELFPFPSTEQNRLNGYVRLGRSLAQLEAELFTERLIAALLGVAVWLTLTIAVWWGIRWFLPSATSLATNELYSKGGEAVSEHAGLAVEVRPNSSEANPQPVQPVSELRQIGQLAIDDVRKIVQARGEQVELSPKEFDLLKLLCEEPGKVYSNDEILRSIWAEHSFASAQDVKQYIYFLRRKLEENQKKPSIIVTVRGFGYKIDTEASGSA